MGQTVSGDFALRDTPAHRPSQLSPFSVVTGMFIGPCPALFCFLGPRVAPLICYNDDGTDGDDDTSIMVYYDHVGVGRVYVCPTKCVTVRQAPSASLTAMIIMILNTLIMVMMKIMMTPVYKSRVSNQNGVSLLYIMLEMHHSTSS